MSGGFFRGTSAAQDTRFSNKQAKLLKSQKFASELDEVVDMSKVKLDVLKPWIAKRVTELLGFEDEVLISYIYGLLEAKEGVDGKNIQIQLTGFMEKNTGKFMKDLWSLLLTAQKNASGIPQQFLDEKAAETRQMKAEEARIRTEIAAKRDYQRDDQDRQRHISAAVESAKLAAAAAAAKVAAKVGAAIQGLPMKADAPPPVMTAASHPRPIPEGPKDEEKNGNDNKPQESSDSGSRGLRRDRRIDGSPGSRSASISRSQSPSGSHESPRSRRHSGSGGRGRSPVSSRSPLRNRRAASPPRRRRSPLGRRYTPSISRSPPRGPRRRSPPPRSPPRRRRSPSYTPPRYRHSRSPPMKRRSPPHNGRGPFYDQRRDEPRRDWDRRGRPSGFSERERMPERGGRGFDKPPERSYEKISEKGGYDKPPERAYEKLSEKGGGHEKPQERAVAKPLERHEGPADRPEKKVTSVSPDGRNDRAGRYNGVDDRHAVNRAETERVAWGARRGEKPESEAERKVGRQGWSPEHPEQVERADRRAVPVERGGRLVRERVVAREDRFPPAVDKERRVIEPARVRRDRSYSSDRSASVEDSPVRKAPPALSGQLLKEVGGGVRAASVHEQEPKAPVQRRVVSEDDEEEPATENRGRREAEDGRGTPGRRERGRGIVDRDELEERGVASQKEREGMEVDEYDSDKNRDDDRKSEAENVELEEDGVEERRVGLGKRYRGKVEDGAVQRGEYGRENEELEVKMGSEEDGGDGSPMGSEERRALKRRRKEEKKERKELRKKKRLEKRKRKEEKRVAKEAARLAGGEKVQADSEDRSDGERSEEGEDETADEQKRREEEELRRRALESLYAKKAAVH